ncbi:MAG: ATPase [Betaproteobacteria bacterium]|nr:ATPase [Betaproteobacteria bacterium]
MANSVGRLLIKEGFISDAQLVQARIDQTRTSGKLEDSLVSLGLLTSEQIKRILHPVPSVPLKIIDTGLNEVSLSDLLLKIAYQEAGTFTVRQIAGKLCLPYAVINELVELLKADHLVTIRSASGYGRETQIFELTQRGRERAEAAMNLSLYAGAAPVPLLDYTRILAQQYVQQIQIDSAWIRESLSHMVMSEKLLDRLGPAFSSGRAIFLYGPPGTGKSSVAEALGRALPDHIYIPQAVEVGGQIIRIFDPAIHFEIAEKNDEPMQLDISANLKHDPRWIKCRRPVVIVGAEFTTDMLDLHWDAHSKFYEAPVQMKAANGVFILDDFGRQKISPREMLNRWIVPLERGTDFLSLHTGMKFEIPFDQINIFCTNLSPADLVDEAFLRRIRHKIKIPHSTEAEYKEILRRVCALQGIQFEDDVANYLIETFYRKTGRALTGSHPRDIVDQIIDFARYVKQSPAFTVAAVDTAAANYFIEM